MFCGERGNSCRSDGMHIIKIANESGACQHCWRSNGSRERFELALVQLVATRPRTNIAASTQRSISLYLQHRTPCTHSSVEKRPQNQALNNEFVVHDSHIALSSRGFAHRRLGTALPLLPITFVRLEQDRFSGFRQSRFDPEPHQEIEPSCQDHRIKLWQSSSSRDCQHGHVQHRASTDWIWVAPRSPCDDGARSQRP